MITPELLEYMRVELAKGRTREEISVDLRKDGGWSEADISEAFRTLIPMQGFSSSSVGTSNTTVAKSKRSWHNLIFIIVGLICVLSWYFFNPQIIGFWNSGVNKVTEFSNSLFGAKENTETVDTTSKDIPIIKPIVNVVKDCGVGAKLDLKDPLSYKNNAVLNCLGQSALICENAKGFLRDDLFPTIFEINKIQDSCNFKLSYSADSTLADITGKKLALQSISCPIDIVKALDSSKKTSNFIAPNIANPAEYASQIYFYGTLGLFIENDVDKSKIQTLGCSGEYISSVILSYLKTQEKR